MFQLAGPSAALGSFGRCLRIQTRLSSITSHNPDDDSRKTVGTSNPPGKNSKFHKDAEHVPVRQNVKWKSLVKDEKHSKNAWYQKLNTLFGYKNVPMSTNLANERNVLYEADIPVKDIIKYAPKDIYDEFGKLKNEIVKEVQDVRVEKPEVLEDFGYLRHREARIEYNFATKEDLQMWRTGSDRSRNEGFTTVNLELTDNKTALFHGDLSTQLVKDGKSERAGWASMKLEKKLPFLRKYYHKRWRNFTHLLIKCRGDGRQYKVMLHSPGFIDLTWGDSHSYALHTHGGPYWQYECIPFSKFFFTVGGRIQDKQWAVNRCDVSSISITIMDRIDGPYKLEIDYIGVVNDNTHSEYFAYEGYTMPVPFTSGM
ncbi:hypothetical protein WR25_24445 [Diploscapter pachys]|uniref:NADH:ubiquinone oxidoreductase intermediate-associated protein 30 domain-containing protein n=1 Tax=Diploscapter pachys TaxID=2018661 RepID=A0A2A2LJ23_9BILA|nr:hypothetical protein WR25_24445 [Diploscapter pachys]